MTTDTPQDARPLVLVVNSVKASIAGVFITRPAAIEAWVGPTANEAGGRVLLRAFGIRDLALALGAMTAGSARDRRRWLLAGGACDLVDAAATFATARRSPQGLGPLATMTTAWAALSGVACLVLAGTEPVATDPADGPPRAAATPVEAGDE